MSILACDLCGGKLIMGTGGIASCDSCGMQHSVDRMREKVQEIKGTVRIDNTHNIGNYLEMAKTAYEAGNNAEAEEYCNRVIEISPQNIEAWYLKGKAVSKSSTLANPRISEGLTSILKAISGTPEEDRPALIEDAKGEILRMLNHYVTEQVHQKIHTKYYAPMLKETMKFAKQLGGDELVQAFNQKHLTHVHDLIQKYKREEIDAGFLLDYQNQNQYTFEELLESISFCVELMKDALEATDIESRIDIQAYQLSISLMKDALEKKGWDSEITFYGISWADRVFKEAQLKAKGYIPDAENSLFYFEKWSANDETKMKYSDLTQKYQRKIEDTKKELTQREAREKAEKERLKWEAYEQSLAAYWSVRQEEKAALESEFNQLSEQIAAHEQSISLLPAQQRLQQLQDEAAQLVSFRDNLGIFKIREKKETQARISQLEEDIKEQSKQLAVETKKINDLISPLKRKARDIEIELTRPR